ncbi:MAG: LysE family transporter [Pseudomonadota bacterium]
MADPTLSPWLAVATIVGLWAVLVVTPGPNLLATLHIAATRTRREGLMVVAGIAVGTWVWATASLAGLGLLFQNAAWLYHAVRVAGAIYLVILGITLIRSAQRQAAPTLSPPVSAGLWRAFRLGFIADMSNPKAAAFFTSLFAVALPPGAAFWLQATAVGIVVAMVIVWYGLVALAMGSAALRGLYQRSQRRITALSGALFAAFGIKLAADG